MSPLGSITYKNYYVAEHYNHINFSDWNNGSEKDADNRPHENTLTNNVILWLDRLLPPVLFLLGMISNTIVVMVMKSKYFRYTSTSFYMIVNSVTDALCLLLALPPHYMYTNYPQCFTFIQGKHWMCSIFNLLGWGTSDLGIYFTVAMTIERAIAVWKPLQAGKLCTKKRAKIIVGVLVIFELVKMGPIIPKSRVADSENGQYLLCGIDRRDRTFIFFYDNIWSWTHVVILTVCYVLAMTGNFVIVFYVKKSCNKSRLFSGMRKSEQTRESRKVSQSRQISIMLVVDSATLIVCTLPFAIVNVMSSHWNTIFLNSDGRNNIAFSLSFYLLYINRCLNLFLYCVSGKRFRTGMKEVIASSLCCIKTGSSPWTRRVYGAQHGNVRSPCWARGTTDDSNETQSNYGPTGQLEIVNMSPAIRTTSTQAIFTGLATSESPKSRTDQELASAEIDAYYNFSNEFSSDSDISMLNSKKRTVEVVDISDHGTVDDSDIKTRRLSVKCENSNSVIQRDSFHRKVIKKSSLKNSEDIIGNTRITEYQHKNALSEECNMNKGCYCAAQDHSSRSQLGTNVKGNCENLYPVYTHVKSKLKNENKLPLPVHSSYKPKRLDVKIYYYDLFYV